jgi:hypothetical protein
MYTYHLYVCTAQKKVNQPQISTTKATTIGYPNKRLQQKSPLQANQSNTTSFTETKKKNAQASKNCSKSVEVNSRDKLCINSGSKKNPIQVPKETTTKKNTAIDLQTGRTIQRIVVTNNPYSVLEEADSEEDFIKNDDTTQTTPNHYNHADVDHPDESENTIEIEKKNGN